MASPAFSAKSPVWAVPLMSSFPHQVNYVIKKKKTTHVWIACMMPFPGGILFVGGCRWPSDLQGRLILVPGSRRCNRWSTPLRRHSGLFQNGAFWMLLEGNGRRPAISCGSPLSRSSKFLWVLVPFLLCGLDLRLPGLTRMSWGGLKLFIAALRIQCSHAKALNCADQLMTWSFKCVKKSATRQFGSFGVPNCSVETWCQDKVIQVP